MNGEPALDTMITDTYKCQPINESCHVFKHVNVTVLCINSMTDTYKRTTKVPLVLLLNRHWWNFFPSMFKLSFHNCMYCMLSR